MPSGMHMVASDEIVTAAVIDADPERRERVVAGLDRLSLSVKAAAGLGIVGAQVVFEAQPQLSFVSFEEPFARAIQATMHAAVASRVVAYSSHSSVDAYRLAIRAGAHIVINSPPTDTELEQAIEQALPRRMPSPNGTSGHVVTVASAKGGTGKSTVAAMVATMLGGSHATNVLLIDFSTEFGDADLLLDIGEGNSTSRAAHQVARSEIQEFRESLGQHESGIFVLGSTRRMGERLPVELGDLEALLDLAARTFDFVVIDTAPVFDDRLMLAVDSADLLLVAAAADVVSIANTRRFLRELEVEGFDAGRQLPLMVGTAPIVSVAPVDAAEVLERQALWEVPYDPRLPGELQRGIGQASLRRSRANRSLAALARRIASEPGNVERRTTVRDPKRHGDPRFAERLRRHFAPVIVDQAPGEYVIGAPSFADDGAGLVVYSTAATVFHAPECALAGRITPANRTEARAADVPPELRPCRVCSPFAAAA